MAPARTCRLDVPPDPELPTRHTAGHGPHDDRQTLRLASPDDRVVPGFTHTANAMKVKDWPPANASSVGDGHVSSLSSPAAQRRVICLAYFQRGYALVNVVHMNSRDPRPRSRAIRPWSFSRQRPSSNVLPENPFRGVVAKGSEGHRFRAAETMDIQPMSIVRSPSSSQPRTPSPCSDISRSARSTSSATATAGTLL